MRKEYINPTMQIVKIEQHQVICNNSPGDYDGQNPFDDDPSDPVNDESGVI